MRGRFSHTLSVRCSPTIQTALGTNWNTSLEWNSTVTGSLRGSFRCKVATRGRGRRRWNKMHGVIRCTRNCGTRLRGQSTGSFVRSRGEDSLPSEIRVLFSWPFTTQFASTLCPFLLPPYLWQVFGCQFSGLLRRS